MLFQNVEYVDYLNIRLSVNNTNSNFLIQFRIKNKIINFTI